MNFPSRKNKCARVWQNSFNVKNREKKKRHDLINLIISFPSVLYVFLKNFFYCTSIFFILNNISSSTGSKLFRYCASARDSFWPLKQMQSLSATFKLPKAFTSPFECSYGIDSVFVQWLGSTLVLHTVTVNFICQ